MTANRIIDAGRSIEFICSRDYIRIVKTYWIRLLSVGMELSSVSSSRLGIGYPDSDVRQTTFHAFTFNEESAKYGSSPNEYEVVKLAETGLETRSRQQTENPLYEDHDNLPVVHPTLLKGCGTKREAAPFLSTLLGSLLALKKERKTCGGASNRLLFVGLILTLLISMSAFILVTLLFVGVYYPFTNCSCGKLNFKRYACIYAWWLYM